MTSVYRLIKRVFDIVASGLALIVFIPLWIVAIVGIEISDFGPPFFVAQRIGKNNKCFKMIKFRSMRVTKEQHIQTLRPEEKRIFKWGKILRKTKIDELPQLVNVFIGDMSVIGPRPVAESQFDLFRTGKYEVTKTVRPGLSGPAAIYDYIYGDSFEDRDIELYKEKVLPTRRELEYVYIKKKSILFDAQMILWTIRCIFCSSSNRKQQRAYNYLVSLANESINND